MLLLFGFSLQMLFSMRLAVQWATQKGVEESFDMEGQKGKQLWQHSSQAVCVFFGVALMGQTIKAPALLCSYQPE